MPRHRQNGQAQAGAQPNGPLGSEDGPGAGIQLHGCKQEQRRHLGEEYAVHLPGESQEVHPRHQDGLCRTQEEEGTGGPDIVPGGGDAGERNITHAQMRFR